MQLRAANVNANDADIHGLLQLLATPVLGTFASSRLLLFQNRSATSAAPVGIRGTPLARLVAAAWEATPPSPTYCLKMDCRGGAFARGTQGGWHIIPDSGKLGATLAHSMMIRFRCAGIAPDSLLFQARPTHFPRAPVRRSTARFHVPSTLFTVHCTAARVFQQSQNVAAWRDSLHVLKLLARGSVEPKARFKHQDRPMCTSRP